MRIVKIQKNLHRILMDYFLTRGSAFYPGVISIKEVSLQSDLKKANVYLSVMGTKSDVEVIRNQLEEDRRGMRDLVNRKLRIKYCPYFYFFINHISIGLSSVEEKIAEMRQKNNSSINN